MEQGGGAHCFCQVHHHVDVLQDLLRDGVGAVELQQQVRREHVCDDRDVVLCLLFCQQQGIPALEQRAQIGKLRQPLECFCILRGSRWRLRMKG